MKTTSKDDFFCAKTPPLDVTKLTYVIDAILVKLFALLKSDLNVKQKQLVSHIHMIYFSS
jgi:hypothetical protein